MVRVGLDNSMIRKPATIAFWRGRLPHWEVEGGKYFVTMNLAGSIPKEGHDRIHSIAAELDQLPKGDAAAFLKLQRRIFNAMESWLDRSQSSPTFDIRRSQA
jgi:hypothetical protein